jgi:hypothetical protein
MNTIDKTLQLYDATTAVIQGLKGLLTSTQNSIIKDK